MTRLRLESGSRNVLYSSLLQNLEFLRNIVSGVETNKAKLHTLTIRVWPAEDSYFADPEYADAQGIADHIRDQIARGLKIQLPDGQPPESLSKS